MLYVLLAACASTTPPPSPEPSAGQKTPEAHAQAIAASRTAPFDREETDQRGGDTFRCGYRDEPTSGPVLARCERLRDGLVLETWELHHLFSSGVYEIHRDGQRLQTLDNPVHSQETPEERFRSRVLAE